MVQTQLLKDILENNKLYEVENIDGKLRYKLDENGNKFEICNINEVEYEQVKLYESKNIKEEFIARKRMGFTLSDEIPETNLVEWITIDDLNKTKDLYLNKINTKTKLSQDHIYLKYSEHSDKRIPIRKGNILVSFKMTIGVTKVYNSEQTAYCNEAIDIVNICDRKKYDSDYISLLIGNEYRKYTQNNVGSITLNDDLKDLIFLKIPKDISFEHKTYSSYELQQSIAKNIEEKKNNIEKKHKILTTMEILCNKKIENIKKVFLKMK